MIFGEFSLVILATEDLVNGKEIVMSVQQGAHRFGRGPNRDPAWITSRTQEITPKAIERVGVVPEHVPECDVVLFRDHSAERLLK